MLKAIKICGWFVISALLMACNGNGKARLIPVADFFKTPEKVVYNISPDGANIAYLQPYNGKQNIYVRDIEKRSVVRLTTTTEKDITYYYWINNKQIVYLKDRSGGRKVSLSVVDIDGTNERTLLEEEQAKISVVDERLFDKSYLLVAMNKRDSSAFDVYKLDVKTGALSMIFKNPGNITDWMVDNHGRLGLAMANDGVNETVLYREKDTDIYKPIISTNFKTTVTPIAFVEGVPDRIYALSNQNRDKSALVEIDCKTGKEVKVIYSDTEVDITEAKYSEVKKHMIYVVRETWKKEKRFLDEKVKRFYQQLEKKLPGAELKVTSRDSAEVRFIIRTFTDKVPGAYYLYNRITDKLIELNEFNPALKESEMCEVKPISYQTRDGVTINGYLTFPKGVVHENLPVVVLPHGGPSGRSSWGFSSEVQFLANRGYAVFQMNYRGSTGYGKAFWTAGFKQWGGTIQNDITDGVKWLIHKGIADPKRIAIYGSNFGGYCALFGLYHRSELYACGASYSGMTNLFSYIKSVPAYYKPYLQMYYEMVGDPDTDIDYLKRSSPIFHTDRIKAPVLIAQGLKDSRTNVNETNQFVKELKKRGVPVNYIVKDNEGHYFRAEANRREFYTELEKFLDANLKKK